MKLKKFLDNSNQTIIFELYKDGRTKYTTLAKKLNVTPAAVKERVERLISKKIIKISALVNPQNFFPSSTTSAIIGIEADSEGVNLLIRKLRNCPLVYHMAKTSGNYNLVLCVLAKDIPQIDDFANKQIRSEPGVRHVEINTATGIIVPEYLQLKLFLNPTENDTAPCGIRKGEIDQCANCPALSEEK